MVTRLAAALARLDRAVLALARPLAIFAVNLGVAVILAVVVVRGAMLAYATVDIYATRLDALAADPATNGIAVTAAALHGVVLFGIWLAVRGTSRAYRARG